MGAVMGAVMSGAVDHRSVEPPPQREADRLIADDGRHQGDPPRHAATDSPFRMADTSSVCGFVRRGVGHRSVTDPPPDTVRRRAQDGSRAASVGGNPTARLFGREGVVRTAVGAYRRTVDAEPPPQPGHDQAESSTTAVTYTGPEHDRTLVAEAEGARARHRARRRRHAWACTSSDTGASIDLTPADRRPSAFWHGALASGCAPR